MRAVPIPPTVLSSPVLPVDLLACCPPLLSYPVSFLLAMDNVAFSPQMLGQHWAAPTSRSSTPFTWQ